MGKGTKIAAVIVVIIAAIVVAYAVTSSGTGAGGQSSATSTQPYNAASSAGSTLLFSITDPPSVPSGTSALLVSYSSLQASVDYANGTSGWVSGSGSGSLDLMQLVNLTQVIGSATVPANSIVTAIRMRIASSNITINGTTYNVTIPSGSGLLTANVTESSLNGTSSALIDFTPSVVTIFTANSSVFVLVPSVKAVLVRNATQASVGARVRLTERDRASLELARPNITVSNAIVSVMGNATGFSVTVTNNANRSVVISHIMLSGNLGVTVTPFSIREDSGSARVPYNGEPPQGLGSAANLSYNSSYDYNYSSDSTYGANGTHGSALQNEGQHGEANANPGDNGAASGSPFNGINASAEGERGNANTNVSAYIEDGIRRGVQIPVRTGLNATANAIMARAIPGAVLAKSFRQVTFLVGSNATLALPFSDQEFNGEGYPLAAHASETFAFNGTMSVGSGHIMLVPVKGSAYEVYVQGENGAHASENVTAT